MLLITLLLTLEAALLLLLITDLLLALLLVIVLFAIPKDKQLDRSLNANWHSINFNINSRLLTLLLCRPLGSTTNGSIAVFHYWLTCLLINLVSLVLFNNY
ncbi:hypothetical protein BA3_0029 [Thalassomonas phage BA3]|uniref:hypothetical protein n=1 Tax=Thalassomonas phage BA3 TaxID=469660 RepID=UPI00015D95A2|nr:hypothetical protein BA3_0029 [Thalassomonas phage BA3]ABV74314.1 hypothetical protein BA3_0029 [Thalassomonas phage BA3]